MIMYVLRSSNLKFSRSGDRYMEHGKEELLILISVNDV